jgi:hypothetical protein
VGSVSNPGRVRALFLLLLLAVPALHAAVLSGVVVDNRTSRPLARTKVILEAPRAAPATTLTNSAGLFTFQGLTAGAYVVRAEREGYAPRSYGQRRFGEPGTPIVLDAGSHFAVELRLARLGAVSGEVADENQVGLPGILVTAYAAGQRFKAAGMAWTDDRGVFRIGGLRPGRYLVRTGAKQLEDGAGLLPTYHGQSASARDAVPVQLKLDEEVDKVRITPLPGRLATLRARVRGGAAERLMLIADGGLREGRAGSDGGFQFEQLEPGAYVLLAEAGARAGYAEIVMGQEDRGVTLELAPAPVLEVRCGGAQGEKVDGRTISVFLRRKEIEETSRRIQCGEKTSWEAGRWELAVATPAEYYVAAILDAERSAALAELRLLPGESTVVNVLLSARPASLEGVVRTPDGVEAPGAPVLLRAAEADLGQRVGGIRTGQADEKGKFRFSGLPPGRYEVVSSYQLKGLEEGVWPVGTATPVALEEGEEESLELPLTPIE